MLRYIEREAHRHQGYCGISTPIQHPFSNGFSTGLLLCFAQALLHPSTPKKMNPDCNQTNACRSFYHGAVAGFTGYTTHALWKTPVCASCK
jgi:hypothetical protein